MIVVDSHCSELDTLDTFDGLTLILYCTCSLLVLAMVSGQENSHDNEDSQYPEGGNLFNSAAIAFLFHPDLYTYSCFLDNCYLISGGTPTRKRSVAKADRSRRCWSAREEAALLSALKELNTNRWKADNGYRAGYLTRLAETIRRDIPITDILPHPHVYSKLTTWKRNYSSLVAMMNRSGVGFNEHGDFKIDCSDEQWAQIVAV